jgi:hypothetical protein
MNVSGFYMRGEGSSGVMCVSEQVGLVGVDDGRVVCIDRCSYFVAGAVNIVYPKGGTATPGLTSFGAPLGLVEIRLETSTNDEAITLGDTGIYWHTRFEVGRVCCVRPLFMTYFLT